MNWLNRLFQKDEFLEEVKKNTGLYQIFFEKMVKVADDKLWAKFLLNPKFATSDEGVKQIEEEEKKTDPILNKAKAEGLNSVALLVIYLQYASADPLFDQGNKKSYWVSVIQKRKSVDSFPDHRSIIHYLERYGYIE